MLKWIIGMILIGIFIYSAFDDRLKGLTFSGHEYDILSGEVKAEKIMNGDQSVRAVASAYNGKDLIKFRIVVKKKIDNSEAKRLVDKFMNEIVVFADIRKSGMLWTKVNLNFDIIDGSDGQVLYQGINNKRDGGVYWILLS